ncbi:MAG: diguanylate cyclase [Proteobacteria bacterium]|nr:diguanylate cyclase [Pseudomonadota bacterium]
MREENKTKSQLIDELEHLRRRVAELEAERKRYGEGWDKDRGHSAESVNELIALTEGPQEEIIQREKTDEKIRKLALAVEQSPTPVVITDSNGNIEYVNPKFAQLTGYASTEAIGQNPRILKSGKQPPELYEELWQMISNGKEWRGEFLNKKKNGDLYWEDASISAIKNEEGVITHFVGVKEDITERKKEEETMRQLAYHDPLTGLPNRLLFKDRLTIALAQANRNRHKLAVMLLDLDHFKDINDTLGHKVGDKLLKAVGKRLIGLLRKNDTVARMGGDEFLLLLPEVKKLEDASTIAQRVMGTLRKPCVVNGHKLRITASIGVALYPDDGQDDDSLMNHADNAMYWAKKEGRNTCRH